jgi:hypothetical protein
MGSPSPTINPLTSSTQWMYFTLNGVPSPGVIIKGGFKGFLRKTGWDEQKGKGTAGATLVLKTMPPSKGSFTLGLFRAFGNPGTYYGVDDFGNFDTFVEQVLAIGPKEQQANGLAIFYPGLSSVGITKVVVEDYSPPVYAGRGMYHVTISLIEWQAPPPVSVVKVVQKSAPALPPPGSGFLVDSERNIQDRNTVNKLRGAAVP